ncbi:MAG: PrkA family serine protein kinase [Promethearchaeota archaeon]|jgi:serine protein kinase
MIESDNRGVLEKLEELSSKLDRSLLWKGTFRQFLEKFEKDKENNTNIGVLAHQRVFNMIMNAGTERIDHFGKERTSYAFFENTLYGIEDSIDAIMSYFHSAAQKTETSRRMLLLYGPPSSGKSDIVQHLKRGIEEYTRTDAGALYALEGSKMHENPFLLIPEKLRPDFENQYGLRIEGQLSPTAAYRLREEFHGKFMDYPVEQLYLDEASRKGIGTWLPQDPKSSDQSELVGSIDFAKIQEFGDEADPRCYNFNGELNVANRGIMEFIEGLKADERFLRVLLTATQEKAIKAPRFGLIYCDTVIILHTNEEEFRNFMAEKKYEAYHDRMVIIKVPYNLSISNEIKIYEKLLKTSDAIKNMHIAPKTLQAAAMFAALTRLSAPPEGGELTLIKKMKLYDKQHVRGHKIEQVPNMRQKEPHEGMSGVSPRFIIDQISASIAAARDEERDYVTALDILRQLNKGVVGRDSFTQEKKNHFEALIDEARREWDDLLKNDIQKAFFVCYEDEARNLCNNYLDQIEAACSGEKPRDPVTQDEIELDEKLMNSIEEQIQISSSGKDDFRNEILRAVGTASRKGKAFDYTQHAQLREAIQKKLFEERKNVIRMTVSTRNPDPDELKRINEVVARMVDQQGYSTGAANALLKYASSHLFDK